MNINKPPRIPSVYLCALFLGLFTAYWQISGIEFWEINNGLQIYRTRAVMQGHMFDPWQYRIFSAYTADWIIHSAKFMGASFPIYTGFCILHGLQIGLIFLLAGIYFKQLGLPDLHSILGLSLMMWGMFSTLYESLLPIDTSFEVIFYLLAAIAILSRRHAFIILIAGLAASNRETSGLIPFMLAASWPASARKRQLLVIAGTALVVFLAVYLGIRLYFGPREIGGPYGHVPFTFDMLRYNFGRQVTWLYLGATVGLIPFLAMYMYRFRPFELRAFFWTIVPAWLVIHSFAAVLAETRLLLVPHILVFIPGLMLGLVNSRKLCPEQES